MAPVYALLVVPLLATTPQALNVGGSLDMFARDWFAFRAETAPITSDDLPRAAVDRPPAWAPNCSRSALDVQESTYEVFRVRLESLYKKHASRWGKNEVADYHALRVALARSFWELRVLRAHVRDPTYYVFQGPGAVWDSLVRQSEWTAERVEVELLPRVEAVSDVLGQGMSALEHSREGKKAFADVALDMLGQNASLGAALERGVWAVAAAVGDTPPLARHLKAAAGAARASIESYARWLKAARPSMGTNSSLGEGNLQWYLRHVALVDIKTDDVVALGRDELARATALLEIERARNDFTGLAPKISLAANLSSQRARVQAAQEEIQDFLTSRGLLDVFSPGVKGSPAYRVEPVPSWLSALEYAQLGEEDDWGLSMGQGFVRYVPDPAPGLPFFLDILARDPRPVIVHEGVPGHWHQFSASRANPREARRHWLDSIANEGLAYYFEQLTLTSGLFDDAPRTRETLYRMQRLRAVRAQVDAELASGRSTPEEAAAVLASVLKSSQSDARAEIATRLTIPGQGLSYAVGKHQIYELLARLRQANASVVAEVTGEDGLDLRAVHNALSVNGNLPIAVQSLLLLGSDGPANPLLTLAQTNFHAMFPGVPAAEVTAVASSPARIRGLPGAPGGEQAVTFSGYVDVGEDDTRSLFYLLVHSTQPPAIPPGDSGDDGIPIVVWLQGGNGCSSLIAWLSENGPFFSPDGANLEPNNATWSSFAHMLYLDRPAGAGFSFYAEGLDPRTFATDSTTAADTLAALRGVFAAHPWLCGRRVFVAGESYAGHFTVQLAGLLAEADDMQLGGVLVGNGVVSLNQTNFAWFEAGYTHSAVSRETWDSVRELCAFAGDFGIDDNGCVSQQTEACDMAVAQWFNESDALAGGLLSLYDYSADVCSGGTNRAPAITSPCIDDNAQAYLRRTDVRAALHVDPRAAPWVACSDELNRAYSCADTIVNVVPLYQELLDMGYPVLVYSGDLDGVVPTHASSRWVLDEIRGGSGAPAWTKWVDNDGQLGGYTFVKRAPLVSAAGGGELTFATVRGAGHMAPRSKGERTFSLVRTWIRRAL